MTQPVPDREEWNRGGGDHDQPYTFGRHPSMYLSEREFAQLWSKFPKAERLEPAE